MKKTLLLVLLIAVIILTVSELLLRLCGFTPYSAKTKPWQVAPRYFLKSDSLLGFRPDTGIFQFATTQGSFSATQIHPGERITSFNDTSADSESRQRILFLGGHNIYGFGLKNEETLPFVFQTMYPSFKVRNLAVPGYGVAADYLLITGGMEVKKGDVFVFMYFADHDKRPSLKLQKGTYADVQAGYNKLFPMTALDKNLQPYFTEYNYEPYPLSQYSALVNFMEDKQNIYSDDHAPEHDIAKKALVSLHQFCEARGATFVLVGRRTDAVSKSVVDFCAKNGVHAVQFPLADNSHNPEKNDKLEEKKIFADKLMQYLQQEKLVPVAL
ncbi:MAG: hypothetical protein V4615_02960 [Bacteroidota bacterium]